MWISKVEIDNMRMQISGLERGIAELREMLTVHVAHPREWDKISLGNLVKTIIDHLQLDVEVTPAEAKKTTLVPRRKKL